MNFYFRHFRNLSIIFHPGLLDAQNTTGSWMWAPWSISILQAASVKTNWVNIIHIDQCFLLLLLLGSFLSTCFQSHLKLWVYPDFKLWTLDLLKIINTENSKQDFSKRSLHSFICSVSIWWELTRCKHCIGY